MKPLTLVASLLVLQQLSSQGILAEFHNESSDISTDPVDYEPVSIAAGRRSFAVRGLQNRLRSYAVGRPWNVAANSVIAMCNSIMRYGVRQQKYIPNMSHMSFVLQVDPCKRVSVPLTRAQDLWTTPGFSPDKPTVIFITGWLSTIDRTNSGPVAKAFACRNDTNFLMVDTSIYLTSIYSWSALNTESIGRFLAMALLKLDQAYVTSRVHVMGHSLGAQVAGATGRNYRILSQGQLLPRVTGLDPANPCFYDGNLLPGVRSGDARYVDILHTNPFMLGTAARVGDADFYVEGLSPIKSGCTGMSAMMCSHERAVDYITESIYPTNAGNFVGRSCPTYEDVRSGRRCSRTNTAFMGLAATARGIFYVDVNPREAFGRHATAAFTSARSTCGTCQRT